ncbi:fuculose phosphate aldolase [Pseudonocardia sp. HH130630-07]|nr:fuculose phosphate aldolase [Pseudonocardia sp. HH130630-07]
MIRIGADAVSRGLVLASGGNLSVRLGADRYLVTCAGTWLDRLGVDDFCVVDGHGRVRAGTGRPSSEWRLHTRTYEARADVQAVIHLHPQASLLVDALGEEIRLVTMDHAHYVRRIARTAFHPNGSDALADSAAAAVADADCVLMAHHGSSCVGADPASAYRRALNLEQAAEMTYRLLAVGNRTATFPPEELPGLHHG